MTSLTSETSSLYAQRALSDVHIWSIAIVYICPLVCSARYLRKTNA